MLSLQDPAADQTIDSHSAFPNSCSLNTGSCSQVKREAGLPRTYCHSAQLVRIRRALPKESPALTEIAHDAKRHWGYPEHWIQHWQTDLTISSDFVSKNPVYVAEHEGELMGFYALVVRDEKAELEHMWVAPKHIGQGIGKDLFIHAMREASGQNVSAIEISSDPNAEGFYRTMGAEKIGEVASEIDGEQRVLPRLSVDPNRS